MTLVAAAAGLTQCLTGFGSALVSMALLPQLLGLRAAAPIVALMAATIEIILRRRWPGLELETRPSQDGDCDEKRKSDEKADASLGIQPLRLSIPEQGKHHSR